MTPAMNRFFVLVMPIQAGADRVEIQTPVRATPGGYQKEEGQ